MLDRLGGEARQMVIEEGTVAGVLEDGIEVATDGTQRIAGGQVEAVAIFPRPRSGCTRPRRCHRRRRSSC